MKKFLSLVLITGLLFLFGCAKKWPAVSEVISTGTTEATTSTTTPEAVTLPPQKVAERQPYENKADTFSIQFPGARTFQENVYGSSVMFFTPVTEGDALKENVGIIKKPLDKDYTLDEYYAITKPELLKLIPGFSEVSNTTIKVNDINAQKLIYTWTQGTTKLKWEQVYLIKNKAVYIITYTATEETFNQFSQKLDEMIATLEIK